MSRERNEHVVKSGMEGIQKGYIYTSALLFLIYKKKKGQRYQYHYNWYRYHYKKGKWEFGTGTALIGTGTAGQILGKLGFLNSFFATHSIPISSDKSYGSCGDEGSG